MTKRNRKHEVQSSEVQSSEAQSSEAQSSEAQSSEAQSSEVQSSEAQSSEAQSSEAQSSEAQSSEAQSSEAQSSEVTDIERQTNDLRNTFIKLASHVVKSNNKKSTWKDVVEKAAINAAKRNFQFRKDSNRDVIYQLLQNDFVTLNDCRLACKNVNRTLISLYTDLHDVANLTKRKLISEKRNNVMYYKLAERIAQVA